MSDHPAVLFLVLPFLSQGFTSNKSVPALPSLSSCTIITYLFYSPCNSFHNIFIYLPRGRENFVSTQIYIGTNVCAYGSNHAAICRRPCEYFSLTYKHYFVRFIASFPALAPMALTPGFLTINRQHPSYVAVFPPIKQTIGCRYCMESCEASCGEGVSECESCYTCGGDLAQ